MQPVAVKKEIILLLLRSETNKLGVNQIVETGGSRQGQICLILRPKEALRAEEEILSAGPTLISGNG